MSHISDSSIELVVTSPPYPMIEMWDDIFSLQNNEIKESLNCKDGNIAFELMHQELDKVWREVDRVLIPGGIVCINIGDATRTLDGLFALYSNHSRIISHFINNGFVNLPNILWRKQTNAPNKFMGSGMLPAGAYVTLEHEWILIFRKGGKREFKSEAQKEIRRKSSFFWEERNVWFSDMWDNIKGVKQLINSSRSRERSAAYPFEIPHRLINMYSLQGDTVLDPFLGTGTTAIAAMVNNRNSVGYEIDKELKGVILDNIENTDINYLNTIVQKRIYAHRLFVEARLKSKELKHFNSHLDIAVVTQQERDISIPYIDALSLKDDGAIHVDYTSKQPLLRVVKRARAKSANITETSENTLFGYNY